MGHTEPLMSSHRSLAFPLGALLLAIVASPLLAAAPADDLLRLHQLRLATQKSLGDFYMYNGMEGDQRYARMIGESLQQGQSRLDELGELPARAPRRCTQACSANGRVTATACRR